MAEQLSLTEIIEFKKTLKQLYPTAVKNVSGKDVIYLEKVPGTDVAIYSDGTAVYSDSYTSTKPRLRRGRDISKAFYEAYDQGYRPIYDPQGTWMSNRIATKKAEKQREMEMTSVFNPVSEVKRKPTPRNTEGPPDIQVPAPQKMQRMQPDYNLQPQQNNEYDPNYFDKVLLNKIGKQSRRGPISNYWETPASAGEMYGKDLNKALALQRTIFGGVQPKTSTQRISEIKKQEAARKKQEKELKKQEKKRKEYEEQNMLMLSGGQLL